jgi:hypothetical protein
MPSSMMQRLTFLECLFCRANVVMTSCVRAARFEQCGLLKPMEATNSK